MSVFHLFLWLSSIPLYVYTASFFQTPIKGCFGYFHVLVFINNAAMSIRVHKTESNKSTIKADKQKLVVTDAVRWLPEGKRSGGGGSEGDTCMVVEGDLGW